MQPTKMMGDLLAETAEDIFEKINEIFEDIRERITYNKANTCFRLIFNRNLLRGEFHNSTAFSGSREIDFINVLLGAKDKDRIQIANDALIKMQDQGAKFTHKRLHELSDGVRGIVRCEEGVDPLKDFVTSYFSEDEYKRHYEPRKTKKGNSASLHN